MLHSRPVSSVSHVSVNEHIDLEADIEQERILNVLDRAIQKIKLAFHLPTLLENGADFKPYLTDNEMELVLKYRDSEIEQAGSNEFQKNYEDRESRPDLSSEREKDLMNLINAREDHSSRILRVLSSKPNLRKFIRENPIEISPEARIFLSDFYELRRFFELRLITSPSLSVRRDRSLRLAWHRNESEKEALLTLGHRLKKQRREIDHVLAKKNAIIQKHEEKMQKLSRDFEQDADKVVHDAEGDVNVAVKSAEYRQGTLKQDVKDTELKLEALLNEHLRVEKELRNEKYKVETELATLLGRYDADIGAKQAELERITAGFDAEKTQMQSLSLEFDVQQVVFERLMAEKQAEYQREIEEKMFIFVCHRAAIRIQRFWRAYRERRNAKKKRKGKKGKSSGGKKTGNENPK